MRNETIFSDNIRPILRTVFTHHPPPSSPVSPYLLSHVSPFGQPLKLIFARQMAQFRACALNVLRIQSYALVTYTTQPRCSTTTHSFATLLGVISRCRSWGYLLHCISHHKDPNGLDPGSTILKILLCQTSRTSLKFRHYITLTYLAKERKTNYR
jgi:hypothetical protein